MIAGPTHPRQQQRRRHPLTLNAARGPSLKSLSRPKRAKNNAASGTAPSSGLDASNVSRSQRNILSQEILLNTLVA